MSPFPESPFPIRMGLRYVRGLGEGHWGRIERARTERAFASVDDFVRRARLDEGTVSRLAEAGAFDGFDVNRRGALWRVKGLMHTPDASLSVAERERTPGFADLDAFDEIGWDYRATGNSPRGHPLEPMREQLRARRLLEAKKINAMRDGRRVRYAGVVICRQRPGTASGVVFLTLEDETGFVNVVVWSQVYEEYRLLVKTAEFLGVTGKLQVQEGVVHLIAEDFWLPKLEVRPPTGGSRDFH